MTNGVRYEKSPHDLKVGDSVSVDVGPGRKVFGRVTGFSQYEGSGLVFVDGMVHVDRLGWPVGHGAVKKVVR